MKVTSTGMAYAKNGSAVTYVFGEEWDQGQPIGYNITYVRLPQDREGTIFVDASELRPGHGP